MYPPQKEVSKKWQKAATPAHFVDPSLAALDQKHSVKARQATPTESPSKAPATDFATTPGAVAMKQADKSPALTPSISEVRKNIEFTVAIDATAGNNMQIDLISTNGKILWKVAVNTATPTNDDLAGNPPNAFGVI